jgi:hypothetical protein
MERDHCKDLSTDGRIMLKCMIKKSNGDAWARLLWLRIWRGGGRF